MLVECCFSFGKRIYEVVCTLYCEVVDAVDTVGDTVEDTVENTVEDSVEHPGLGREL